MFRFLFYTLFTCSHFILSSQERYQLPSGTSREQIDENWIILKVKNPAIPITLFNSENRVIVFHEKDPHAPSIMDGVCKVKLTADQDLVEVIDRLLKDPNVVYAEPILRYQPLYAPADPNNTTSQPYLEQIKAYDAWGVTRGDDDITIGIVDTGLDLDHQDLIASLWINESDPIDGIDNDNNGFVDDWHGYDFADSDSEPDADGSSHGSQVGGIAGASTDNNVGISGVGFNTKIAALKGFRTIGTVSSNLFEAITYAADNGIEILNLSWGALRSPLQSEQDVIDYAVLEKDVVVIAAGGNTDVDGKFYPASYDHVLSVGGVDRNDSKWVLSTYNYAMDIVAPSTGIFSTTVNDGYKADQGTSFAAPMVAGAAALVRAQFPKLNAEQIMERVRVTADDIYGIGGNVAYDGKLGLGRLNVYNAVAQTNVKALRATDFTTSTSQSETLFFGDTVQVQVAIKNYLARLTNPQITISSPDNLFLAVEPDIFPGSIQTLQEDSISFSVVLGDDVPPASNIAIRLDIQDGIYRDFQVLEAQSSPDYYDFGTNLKTTVTGNGNLSFTDETYAQGIGMDFNGVNILSHAGLVVGTSAATVSDNFISNYSSLTREQDFSSFKNFKLFHHPAADLHGYSEFEDPTNNLIIEQSSYAWENKNFLVFRYRLINNSTSPINGLSVGFFSDFDLSDTTSNKASFEVSNDYLLTRDNGSTIFAGTKVLSNGTLQYSAIDLENENGNTSDIGSSFTDTDKYDFIRNLQLNTAGAIGIGNNVATLNGSTFNQIDPYESAYFTVIVAAGNSQVAIESALTEAESNLDSLIKYPRVLERSFSCEGSQVTIDPQSGTNFRFYEDPDGSTLITEGTHLVTGAINADTTFYISNIDGTYASDLFQYQIKLIDEVSDFEMSTDTLYLDHETNVVSFTDQSFRANTWSWDFGEGTQASIQNPTVSFNQVGEYTISLHIENDLGCTDTQTKTLVVANRPLPPVLNSFNICPQENVLIADAGADYLKVFENETDQVPHVSGNNLLVGPFKSDTTLYVSGIYSQYESLKIPVLIDVDEVNTNFTIEIDTISTAHQIVAEAQALESSFEWFVDGVSQGTSSAISIGHSTDPVTIQLHVENSRGCQVITERVFEFSSSITPTQADVTFCRNDSGTISPQNGQIFGFYEDEALSRLIKKGRTLNVSNQTKIYVVGLDDGFPSPPVEVNISWIEESIQILSATEWVGDKNQVTLSIAEEGYTDFKWYIDRTLAETTAQPVLFLQDEVYEVVLDATNSAGCQAVDTLILDLSPNVPLGVSDEIIKPFYPNPSNGIIHLDKAMVGSKIEVWNLNGKQRMYMTEAKEQVLNLQELSSGIYLIRFSRNAGVVEHKLLIR